MDNQIKESLICLLKMDFERARSVCDPIEFQKRQQTLLYTVCDLLLEIYDTKRDS
jgi:hypothetical protein